MEEVLEAPPAIATSPGIEAEGRGENNPSRPFRGIEFLPEDFSAAVTSQKEIRALINTFIRECLVEGVDFGKIAGDEKPSLWKPGAEKFLNLFRLKAVFEKDEATLSMLSEGLRRYSVIAYICRLRDSEGKEVAEGRGACTVFEKEGEINTAIKTAEKRAMVDACLRAYGISDSFTQDLEDFSPGKEKGAETEKLRSHLKKVISHGYNSQKSHLSFSELVTTGISQLDVMGVSDLKTLYTQLKKEIDSGKSQNTNPNQNEGGTST